jgi:hypothetical protein
MTLVNTREAWLLQAIDLLRPLFLSKGHQIPEQVSVSCGFASTGNKIHIGQCWSRQSSTNECNQVFISPTVDDPVTVLDILVHELVHAVDDCQHKHGKEFKKIALSLGMKGPMRSAEAGPELKKRLEEMALKLGPYPHGKLKQSLKKTVRKARARARCPECNYEVPMYKRFLSYGPPLCPAHKVEMSPLGEWEDV